MWLTADQLPDLPRKLNYFRLTEYECVSLGKKLSFHLRALARERNVKTVDLDDELSAAVTVSPVKRPITLLLTYSLSPFELSSKHTKP